MKILIVQTVSIGDCLLVTPLVRQLKEVDFPGCHVSWLVASSCRQVLENNPYIDEIIEMPFVSVENARSDIPSALDSLNKNGRVFDKIIITDYTVENRKNLFGPLRAALLRGYEGKITIPMESLIFLTKKEVDNVAAFAQKHRLGDFFCILCESSPQSGQSDMNVERALRIARMATGKCSQVKFILSSKNKVDESSNIIDGSILTWRENAELTKYCKLLLGCSSGITWLNTTGWSAKIPMLQNIKSESDYAQGIYSVSVELDFIYWGLQTDKIIELWGASDEKIVNCIYEIATNSFDSARNMFKEDRYFHESKGKENIIEHFAQNATQAFHNSERKFYSMPATFYLKRFVARILRIIVARSSEIV